MDFVSLFRCPDKDCGGSIQCSEDINKRQGFSVFLQAYCETCETVVAKTHTSKTRDSISNTRQSRTLETNRAVVYASMRADIMSVNKLSDFCANLDMPVMSQHSFYWQQQAIYEHKNAAALVVSSHATLLQACKRFLGTG